MFKFSTLARMPSWLTWTLVALLVWGVWAVLSKVLGEALTAGQSQALSTFGILPVLVPLLFSHGSTMAATRPKGLLLAAAGGIVTCLGNMVYYAALARGGKVAVVVSLTALYPLVTVLLAVLFLRERLNRIQLVGVALSLVAIWLFNIQGGEGLLSGTLVYSILPVVCWGLSGFLQKIATNHVSAEIAALVYLGTFIPVGVFLGLSEPWPKSITPATWGIVLALGFFLSFGNFAILRAFARGGKAAIIAPLGSLYPIVSVPIAVFFLHESVTAKEVFGVAFALISVAALSCETPHLEGLGQK